MTLALVKAFAKAIRNIKDKDERKKMHDFIVNVFIQIQPSFAKEIFSKDAGVK